MLNKVILIGRPVKDAELWDVANGTKLAKWTLAAPTINKDGVLFIDCKMIGKTELKVAQFIRKGEPIAVEGSLVQEIFDKRDGTKGSAIVIIVNSLELLQPKKPEAETKTVPQADVQQASK